MIQVERGQNSSAPKLRIMQVAARFPPFMGGIELHTFEVGRRMAAMGHLVTVLTGDPTGALPKQEDVSGMQVLRVPVYPKSSDVFFAPAVYGKLLRADFDIAHIQGFHTFFPPLAMLGAIRSSTAFVATFHSGGHSSPLRQSLRGTQMAILRPLMVRADRLVAVSQFEADRFAAGLRVRRDLISVVSNGAEIEAASEVARPDRDRPVIISVGRLERYKGHHRVILAFAELLKIRPNATLKVIGEGPYKPELLALVEKLGLKDRVAVGGIPPERRKEMGSTLASASVIVLLSDYEAHPVAALEAISLGCSVIANNSTGFAEMAKSGLLRGIDPQASPKAVAAAIVEEIDRSPDGRRTVKIANWDDCTGNLLDIYFDVVGARRQTAGGSAPRHTVYASHPTYEV
jgi:glycosyltransferase involved in cell wall biosynthesis